MIEDGLAPEWTADFVLSELEIVTSERKRYGLFEKAYSAGDHVVIPSFEGEHTNYFALAVPTDVCEAKALLRAPERPSLSPYPKRNYVCYLSEAFKNGIPVDFETTGEVVTANIYSDKKYTSAKLCAGSSMNKSFPTSSLVVATATVTTASEDARFRFGALKMEGGMFKCGGKVLCPARIGVPTSVKIRYNYRDMTADVEINHLAAGKMYSRRRLGAGIFQLRRGRALRRLYNRYGRDGNFCGKRRIFVRAVTFADGGHRRNT